MSELERLRLRQALTWHLAYNFIPPQPAELIDYCLEAISACNAGYYERAIKLPGGVIVTAGQLVEDLKLDDLIETQ